MVGCDCSVCTSSDPRDRRLRPSAMLQWEQGGAAYTVVIDTGPDFREQALRAHISRIDAVFYTHANADHIFGLDDLRPVSFRSYHQSGAIPLYVTEETRKTLERVYSYTFSPNATYPNRARVSLQEIGEGVTVGGVRFERVPVLHGSLEIAGYRFGNTAYLTDVSEIPPSGLKVLEGVEQLITSALRHKQHPNHSTVEQAIGWAHRVGARRTWFTHIAHDLGHEVTNSTLPEGIEMAYDGLTIPVELGSGSL